MNLSRHETIGQRDYAFQAWVERARGADIEATATSVGARLKKAGAAERIGPCPRCGGTDRFSINIKERVFNCRGAGQGGDVIALVQHVKECTFVQACEIAAGEPRPGRDATPIDPAIERELREERLDRELERQAQDDAELTAAISIATELFESSAPIRDTWADDYLERRGIVFRDEEAINLRFLPELTYWGFPDRESKIKVELGAFPVMLAAIRDRGGRITGVHETFFDARSPIKLVPPGDRARNKAKKVHPGTKAKGGMIWLGPIKTTAAIGEGIETVWSWHRLGIGPEDISIASAVSLGNLSGGATGTLAHPKIPGRSIMNGEPDMARPGIVLPDLVRSVILLGDGDSEPAETRAKMLVAGRRQKALGREVAISMAPIGVDWNNVLLKERGAAQC